MGIYFNEFGNIYLEGNKPIIGTPVFDHIVDWWKLDEDVVGEVNGYTGSTDGTFSNGNLKLVSNLNVLNSFPPKYLVGDGGWTLSFFVKDGNFDSSLEVGSTYHNHTTFRFYPRSYSVFYNSTRYYMGATGEIIIIGEPPGAAKKYDVLEQYVDWSSWSQYTWTFVGNRIGELVCYRNGSLMLTYDGGVSEGGKSELGFTGFIFTGTPRLRDILIYDKVLSSSEVQYNYNALK